MYFSILANIKPSQLCFGHYIYSYILLLFPSPVMWLYLDELLSTSCLDAHLPSLECVSVIVPISPRGHSVSC